MTATLATPPWPLRDSSFVTKVALVTYDAIDRLSVLFSEGVSYLWLNVAGDIETETFWLTPITDELERQLYALMNERSVTQGAAEALYWAVYTNSPGVKIVETLATDTTETSPVTHENAAEWFSRQ